MLPFLKIRKMSPVIIAKVKPEGNVEVEKEEGGVRPEMLAIADALISAIHSKDSEAVADVLEAAIEACSMHEEYEEGAE